MRWILSAGITVPAIGYWVFPKWDPKKLYLAYHEGHGGYRRGTHRNKKWLLACGRSRGQYSARIRRTIRRCDEQVPVPTMVPGLAVMQLVRFQDNIAKYSVTAVLCNGAVYKKSCSSLLPKVKRKIKWNYGMLTGEIDAFNLAWNSDNRCLECSG